MTLREDFRDRGQWLFARRSYVPLAIIPMMGLLILLSKDYPQPFALTQWWKIGCLVVAFLGEGIRIIAVGSSAPSTSGRNTGGQLADSINTTGIYSVVRHPLYIGNFFVIFGIVLWSGVWWFVLLVSILYWFYYERIMFTEEEFLVDKFGEQYIQFAATVPAVIPSFKSYKSAKYPFSAKIVLAREYDGVLAIATSFLLLAGIEYYALPGNRPFDLTWPILFVVIYIAAAILRYVRKHTSLLKVEGR
ncbi:MAG TPA: isoprenylcysteine carboxylmethyltransferase family protein [Candidatus Kapabacteria bacterium]|nr:isoprenylcysteine carboxylmethyltransferase family protein [Candidatus Kapabacteria bacterium]